MVEAVPVGPVVYFLSHAGKRVGYVGSCADFSKRRKVWRKRLECAEVGVRADCVSVWFFKAARETCAADWSFRILAELPLGVPMAEVRELEYLYARCFYRLWPESCLNVRRDNHERFFHHHRRDDYDPSVVGFYDRRYRSARELLP